jgi:chemotaxis protein MotB
MSPPSERPIIVVKRHKRRSHAHHGGAWKVAYADFVTAMMAFFLVMWLVTAVSKDQRAAIFDYFKNPSMEPGRSAKPAPGQMGPGGASTSPIDLHGGLDSMRSQLTPIKEIGATEAAKPQSVEPAKDAATAQSQGQPLTEEEKKKIQELTLQAQQDAEHKKLESLMEELRQAVEKSQALEPYKDQLLLDITPEGVRIQIVDAQNRPMFDVGSARLRDYTVAILKELAKYLATVSNRVSISGHTDIRPYPGNGGYSNWELSADRANAARRALIGGGLPDEKIARVVGLASSVLFDKAQPDNPINRRISIIVMTKQAEEEALKTDTASGEAPTPSAEPAAAPEAGPPATGAPATATGAPAAATSAPAAATGAPAT